MARRQARPRPEQERTLVGTQRECPACGKLMRIRYENRRTVVPLNGPVRLRLKIRRCESPACAQRHRAHRPEAEGAIALPQHEFALDVIARVGALRHREHRSVPEIHRALRERGVVICERSVTNLLERYEELALLLREVADKLGVPIEAVLSDGQRSIRQAVARALPGVPHQLCHFHYLREAALPIYEADRHAKKELKKRVRGVRPIERGMEGREDAEAQLVRGYCAAVRSAITDDGRPPLAASGLKLRQRLTAVAESLDRVAEKGD